MPWGIGGNVTVPAGDVAITEWRFKKGIDTQDATDSDGVGWRERETTIKDATGSFNTLFNPLRMLETDLSLDIGDVVDVTFKLGNTGKGYKATIIIKDVETMVSAKGDSLIGQNISWENEGAAIVGPVAV